MESDTPPSAFSVDAQAAGTLATLAGHLARELGGRLEERADRPLVVALDGRSGSGKSTLAAALAVRINAVVIPGDDFYAGGTPADWDRRNAAEKAMKCIDWRRQRAVLAAIRRGEPATWRSFDWDAFDGRLAEDVESRPVAPFVVLEGAYSARPELADLIDVRVLLDTPPAVRRRQLLDREGDLYQADWEARWSEAEDHYFNTVVPPESFDFILVP
ncbi:MAG: hypothetical protein M3Z46_05200 [Actinomycetota bacterium]|nr:hypothetical protein [Actinomycetota bacterium]